MSCASGNLARTEVETGYHAIVICVIILVNKIESDVFIIYLKIK
jgi:hypothetical protein